jgi:hypothetical protein
MKPTNAKVPHETVVCMICKKPLKDAVQCERCHNNLCRKCADVTSILCPKCKVQDPKHRSTLPVEDLMDPIYRAQSPSLPQPTLNRIERIEEELKEAKAMISHLKDALKEQEAKVDALSNELQSLMVEIARQDQQPTPALPGSLRVNAILDKPEMSLLTEAGWKIAYDKPYSHHTTLAFLQTFPRDYPGSQLACVGAYRVGETTLHLAAIASIQDIFTLIEKSKAIAASKAEGEARGSIGVNAACKVGEVYWYLVEGMSFGFSDSPDIVLNDADSSLGPHKLSWHINGTIGGYRVGDFKALINNDIWHKIILIAPS